MKLNDLYIDNFPWDKKEHEKVKKWEPSHCVNWWYIDNKMPDDFLDNMHKWMIENKGFTFRTLLN